MLPLTRATLSTTLATPSPWLPDSHSLASQLTLTANSSLSLASPCFCLSPTTLVFRNRSWPGSRRPIPWNYSIERPTIYCWASRRFGFLATLFIVRPISLRSFAHDTAISYYVILSDRWKLISNSAAIISNSIRPQSVNIIR